MRGLLAHSALSLHDDLVVGNCVGCPAREPRDYLTDDHIDECTGIHFPEQQRDRYRCASSMHPDAYGLAMLHSLPTVPNIRGLAADIRSRQ